MHNYKKKNRIATDRPQGINIPGGGRRVIKVTSGDTLSFTATVVIPTTREPVSADVLDYTNVHIAIAENRFSPVIWSGSIADKWIYLDENRKGLIHITVPRTVMNCLRRGSYAFSIVVDDGIVRETQLTGNFQVEYEPTGTLHDIPYRSDPNTSAPISLSPEVDLAAQQHRRMTYDQLITAVDSLSKALLSDAAVKSAIFGDGDYNPTEDELDSAVHRIAQIVVWDDELREKLPQVVTGNYNPAFNQLVERVCQLLTATA